MKSNHISSVKAKKEERIEYLEKEMRRLFSLAFVNDDIVKAYSIMEKEWKHLTRYHPNINPVLVPPKNKFEAIRHKEMLGLLSMPEIKR